MPGAQHVGVELVAAGGDAERARGALGVLDGAQIEAHAALLDAPGQEQDGGEHGEEDVVVGHRRGEGEVEHGARHGRPRDALRAADPLPVGDEHAHQLGDRDRRHAEVVAGQPQRRHADHRRDQHRDERRRSGRRRSAAGRSACSRRWPHRRRRRRTPRGRPRPGRRSRPIRFQAEAPMAAEQHERAEPLVDRRARGQQRIGQRERGQRCRGGDSAASRLAHQALRPASTAPARTAM